MKIKDTITFVSTARKCTIKGELKSQFSTNQKPNKERNNNNQKPNHEKIKEIEKARAGLLVKTDNGRSGLVPPRLRRQR